MIEKSNTTVAETLAAPQSELKAQSYWGMTWQRLRRHRLAMISMLVLSVLVATLIFGPNLVPHTYQKTKLRERLKPASNTHRLGTDELGRDILARLLQGGRISLFVGIFSALIGSLVGVLIGAVSGYYGGIIDAVLMRFTDIMLSVPTLPLLLILGRFVGGTMWGIIAILVAFGWMSLARIVRGSVLSVRELEFINAAYVVGAPHRRVIFIHILPNVLAPVIVYTTLNMGYAILAESSLSYLGLGIQPPMPSWGNMLLNAQPYLQDAPWLALYPGFCIFITLLSFNFLGDGLRDALDPRMKI
jgi:peptide/nickel transport system permease protein